MRMRFRRALFALTTAATLSLLSAAPAAAPADAVARARKALGSGRYELAQKALSEAAANDKQAMLLRTRLLLRTGNYTQAVSLGRKLARSGTKAKVAAAPWIAEALARQGKLDAAIKELEAVSAEGKAHRANLLLGELYIRQGKRARGRQALMRLIDAYNSDDITSSDAAGLSMVGRAAYLMRAYRDANDAFNEAEKAGAKKRVETLLWRAELFLDKYNPGRAGQVVQEASKIAPGDPRVQVAMAHVKLAQTMDFAAADKLVESALKIDKQLAAAYFVRAGLSLRVMDPKAAEQSADIGLKADPSNLELLSIKAAARFLAEDEAGFAALEKQVLKLNPEYSRFYSIVGEFAEWEHRYEEIVALMNKAAKVDPQDAKAFATMGLNLIRNGNDKAGIDTLRKAWKRDKYNVRVYNTLNLFEETIPKEYVTVNGTTFRMRYHKEERAVLERYVPRMLEKAWGSMVSRYKYTPKTPVGIELYADSEHFSIRTSGLPNVGIQGVCFGKTLAALSPSAGSFNWGMILWHELAHVFHIQMSKNRVPRWFTEGLAEYETIIVRPEWQREEHVALFHGLKEGKIPKVASFNRAFTHVDDPRDVTMAYFAASQISVFLAEEFGFDKIVAHLPLWAAGKQTPEIVQQALGISADELDRRYRAWLKPRLARYDRQFMPDLRPPKSVEEGRNALTADPQSVTKHVKLALALLGDGKVQEGKATLALALQKDPKHKDALFVQLRIAMSEKDLEQADKLVTRLLAAGGDGYALRMKAADIAELQKNTEVMQKHLTKAHEHDPSQAEPLQALYDMARKAKDENGQLSALRQLSKLDQHDRRVYGRLLGLLVKRGLWEEAVSVGESAIFIDVMNPQMHALYGRALARSGRHISAIYEYNSALLARPKPAEAAKIYRTMAEGYRKLGKAEWAARAEVLAKQASAMARPPAAEHSH